MNSAKTVSLVTGYLLLWFTAAWAADPPTRSVRDGVYTNRQADRGRPLYHENCERCHGEDLDGDEAPPLSDPEFIADWKGYTLGDVFERIRTAMPGDHPGLLKPAECADVLALILRSNGFPAGSKDMPSTARELSEIRMEPPAQADR